MINFEFGAKTVSTLWSVAAGSMLAEAFIPPTVDGWMEKLGVLGIVVAGSYYLMKYFMDTLSKKDELLRMMNEKNTADLVAVIREGHTVHTRGIETQVKMIETLNHLTATIAEVRDDSHATKRA